MRSHQKPEVDLSGAKITKGMFEHCDFRGIEAHEAKHIEHVRFDHSDLSGGKIQCTVFDACDMQAVSFVETDFTSPWGICSLTGVRSMSQTSATPTLRGHLSRGLMLRRLGLTRPTLRCDMEYFEAPQASFKHANLKGANLEGANLFATLKGRTSAAPTSAEPTSSSATSRAPSVGV